MLKHSTIQRAAKGKGKSKGFTLIEVIAALVILGIFYAALAPFMSDANLDRKITVTKGELTTIARGVQKTYRSDGVYPSTIPWDDVKHHFPKGLDETNEWGQDYVLKGGGITYGSGCSLTSRTSDMTLFNIQVVLPANTGDAALRMKDDFDDCSASVSGTTVAFEYD
ncbi:prepilin-type N-terminal cleavage/methylation domain-containing protein [Vibrio parahaemolyticus]|nr:prepilin-type N-terminal cleavage/methylation domain-containing protein [Vibrio parahaemolyticus]